MSLERLERGHYDSEKCKVRLGAASPPVIWKRMNTNYKNTQHFVTKYLSVFFVKQIGLFSNDN